MTGPVDGGVAAARAEIAAAADLLARARRELAAGRTPAIDPLPALVEALERRLGSLSVVPADLRPALLALLDEAARLAGELDVEMGDLAGRLCADGIRRRAEEAYRRPSSETF
jgi:hypothetical protein